MIKNFFLKTVLVLLLLLIILWAYFYIKLVTEDYKPSQISQTQMTQARDYLEGKLHPAPSGWRWSDFKTSYGVSLRTGRADAAQPKGTVIFVPGFTGTLEMAMDIIHGLHNSGYNVAAVEYRGQGGSYRPLDNPEKGYVESYEILAKEVAEFADANRDPNLPLYFFSVSKGAHITMRMAGAEMTEVDAYALIVPMIKINTEPLDYDMVALLAKTLNTVGLGDMYAPGQTQWPPMDLEFNTPHPCNANPSTAQYQSALFAVKPELRAHGSTVKWIYETNRSTELLQSPSFVKQITQPVMVVTAGDDRLVSTPAIKGFCDSLSNCNEVHYQDARHCITPESFERTQDIISKAVTHFETSANKKP